MAICNWSGMTEVSGQTGLSGNTGVIEQTRVSGKTEQQSNQGLKTLRLF